MPHVAVVGGGIAGLSAAFHLRREGLAVSLFEASSRAGGVIRSEQAEGYLVEAGPNSVQPGHEALEHLVDAVGLSRVEADAAARKRYVVRGGRLVPLPASPPELLTTRLFSLRSKLALLGEPFRPPAPSDVEESVAAFVRRRLGEELLAYAVDPFVGGIFAGDPELLSLPHAFPRLHALEQEHGSLLRGAMRQAGASGRGAPKRRLYTFEHGLQALPDALATALGTSLNLDAPVTALRPAGRGWEVLVGPGAHVQRADAIVLALPLHRLAGVALGGDLGRTVDLAPLHGVGYPPVSVVALGFRRESIAHPLDGFGLLVPTAEAPLRILGTLFSSTLFPERAPAGHVLLTTFVGGTRRPELARATEGELIRVVQEDLEHLLGLAGPPAFARRFFWPHAIPQYHLGYGRVKAAIAHAEAHAEGLAFAGNYRQGISVGDAAASGMAAAARLLETLR